MNMKTLLAGAFALAVTVSASAADWFTGGFDASWPSSTSTGGAWDSGSAGTWDETAQAVSLPNADSVATFNATDAKDLSTNKIVITTKVKFTAYDVEDLATLTTDAKVGLTAVETDSATTYYYLAANSGVTANEWKNSGIAATVDSFVDVEITIEDNVATYKVGGTPIAANVAIYAAANATAQTVQYKGLGSIKTLAGTTEFLENGTAEHPFLIGTKEKLVEKLITNFASLDADHQNFVLTDNIDLKGCVWDGPGESRTNEHAFVGIFDGKDYTISNLTLAKKEYNGFIGCACGKAQIKNVTIQVAGFGGEEAESYGGAGAVGFSMGTDVLVERVTVKGQTSESVLSGTHNIGGAGCRLEGKITLKDCTNELALATTYTKIAGMCPIASSRDADGLITFDGCVNKGSLTGTGSKGGVDGCAGILGYIQSNKLLVIKNCESYGAISTEVSTAKKASIFGYPAGQVIDGLSGNKASTNVVALAYSNIDGLNFATVDADGIATLVPNSEAVSGADLKVMAAGAPVKLANVGDTITLDESLAKAAVTSGVKGYEVVKNDNVYSLSAINYPITVTDGTASPATYTVAGAVATLAYTGTPVATKKFSGWTINPAVAGASVSGDTLTIAADTTGAIAVQPTFVDVVAKVDGGDSYTTLAAALAAVPAGGTVKVLVDLTVTAADIAAITKDFTFDANGNVVTLESAKMAVTNNITFVCSGEKTEKGFRNWAQIEVAEGKTLDLSALSWGLGIVAAGQAEPTATFKLYAGATYVQGLGTVWDDALKDIFSTVEGQKITLVKGDGIATIKAEKSGGDIPADPSVITPSTKPEDIGLDPNGPFKDAQWQELVNISTWANKVGYKAADINANVTFEEGTDGAVRPTTEAAEAYLLDCTLEGLAAAKEEFKVPAIEVDGDGNVTFGWWENGGSYGYGYLLKLGATSPTGPFAVDTEDPTFFKFELVKDPLYN